MFECEFRDIETSAGRLKIVAYPALADGTALKISVDLSSRSASDIEAAMRQLFQSCEGKGLEFFERQAEVRYYPTHKDRWDVAADIRWHPALQVANLRYQTVEVVAAEIHYEPTETVLDMTIRTIGDDGRTAGHRIVLESFKPWAEQSGISEYHELLRALGEDGSTTAVTDTSELLFRQFTVGMIDGELVEYINQVSGGTEPTAH